jgi:glutathione S-transferase
MSGFVVHGVPGSPYVRAVLATLEEKGLPYRIAALTPGQHRQEPYVSMNPFSRMPTIQHDDFVLYETQAILRYIDRVAPQPALTPA